MGEGKGKVARFQFAAAQFWLYRYLKLPPYPEIPGHNRPARGKTPRMDTKIFWDVFRDTGDPLCWLLTRVAPAENKKKEQKTNDRAPSRPLS